MAPSPPVRTTGTSTSPIAVFEQPELLPKSSSSLAQNDLRSAIVTAFSLPETDSYVYHAIASVTLSQVQSAVEAKSANGLHNWYIDSSGESMGSPPQVDSEAYVSLFNPKNNAANSLKSLASNAKKGSLRQKVAEHLIEKRYLDERFAITKKKKPPLNPYYDFWAWSCRSLEWAGPMKETTNVRMSHHVLPIFMHHFGCVVPSHEAIEILRQVSSGRTVLDIGSGNGYWTLMMRNAGLNVTAVDSRQSEYRTMWIGDTIVADGIDWLKGKGGGKDSVLLMVYPVTEGGFTSKLLPAFKGDAICVAGTQNKNGYTGFKDMDIAEYMAKERQNFEKTVQIPLPSFAGKDEALFVFQKKTS